MLSININSIKRWGIEFSPNLNVEIQSGDIVFINGLNGCGKTTILDTLSGFSKRYTGQIVWCGENIKSMPTWRRHRYIFGRLFQNFHGSISADTLLEFCSTQSQNYSTPYNVEFSKINDSNIAIENILIGIDNLELPLNTFSAGQQRRILFAATLKFRRPVYLLDEPLANIDQKNIRKIFNCIQSFSKLGHSFIIANHIKTNIDILPNPTIHHLESV